MKQENVENNDNLINLNLEERKNTKTKCNWLNGDVCILPGGKIPISCLCARDCPAVPLETLTDQQLEKRKEWEQKIRSGCLRK